MNAPALLAAVEGLGIALKAEGEKLLYRPKDAVPGELLSELKEHKGELLEILPFWCPESAEAVRCFGSPEAWLYPYLDKTVETEFGAGVLVQVLGDRVSVVLNREPSRMAFFDWRDVRPVRGPASGGQRHA